jgi:glycosyltransferase involved in cell wall biosynthesis
LSKKASIIICTRNRADELRKTLESFANVVVPPKFDAELIIVDNGSSDATPQIAQGCQLSAIAVRYVMEPRQGQALARNSGLAAAGGEIILFTDDDVRPTLSWLVTHVRAYDDPDVAAVKGRVELDFDGDVPSWLGPAHRAALAEVNRGDAPEFPHLGHLVGANMSFRKQVPAKIGPFNPMLGPGRAGFWDDSEFSIRLMGAGFKQRYEPQAVVFHQIPASRLTAEYFLDAAFRNGLSSYIASPHPRSTYRFARSIVSAARRRVRGAMSGVRAICSTDELVFRMECGSFWAYVQGMDRLTRRYGRDATVPAAI